MKPTIHVAIPALDENRRLPHCLEALDAQTDSNFRTWICVNQPEAWWSDPRRRPICWRNVELLSLLEERHESRLEVIDRSSRGRGWPPGRDGIGWARKTLLDRILERAGPQDLLVGLDADTLLERAYLAGIRERFAAEPSAVGLSAPYYHPLSDSEDADRAVLRYEFYLRHYLLCLLTVRSPWAFTALGSGTAAPLAACRRVGGITPKASGEDFYFLQKLRKTGPLLLWTEHPVRPAARFSERVIFGTGPAMLAGHRGEWHRYPIYALSSFREIEATASRFPELHRSRVDTPMDPWLKRLFGTDDPWAPLRRNHPDPQRFSRACHERLDGLRLLQYLRIRQAEEQRSDEERMLEGLRCYAPEALEAQEEIIAAGGFERAPLELLDVLRNLLFEREARERREHDRRISAAASSSSRG